MNKETVLRSISDIRESIKDLTLKLDLLEYDVNKLYTLEDVGHLLDEERFKKKKEELNL